MHKNKIKCNINYKRVENIATIKWKKNDTEYTRHVGFPRFHILDINAVSHFVTVTAVTAVLQVTGVLMLVSTECCNANCFVRNPPQNTTNCCSYVTSAPSYGSAGTISFLIRPRSVTHHINVSSIASTIGLWRSGLSTEVVRAFYDEEMLLHTLWDVKDSPDIL